MNTVQEWEQYLEAERQKLTQSQVQMQGLLDESQIPLTQLDELSKIDPHTLDPETLQLLQIQGMQTKVEKPAKDASHYMQRRNVMIV
jgi:hypothetical protein